MRFLSLFLFFLLSQSIFAQEETDTLNSNWKDFWTIQGRAYLNLSQGSQFNWANGGDDIFSSLIKTKTKAKYKKGKQIWDNELNWNYGFLFIGVPKNNRKNIEYRTTDDNIELNSSFGYQAKGNFYYNAFFNFKTQFFPAYKYPNDSVVVSNFLSPAYVVFALGINYKPNEMFKLMVSPLTSKTTLVVKESQVDETKFGLKEGERLYRELGAYIRLNSKHNLYENVTLENELVLFSNYEHNPENIDFELKTDLHFKINKNLKALLAIHFIYDDDASIPINEFVDGVYKQTGYTKGLQFQEKIMIGLGFNF